VSVPLVRQGVRWVSGIKATSTARWNRRYNNALNNGNNEDTYALTALVRKELWVHKSLDHFTPVNAVQTLYKLVRSSIDYNSGKVREELVPVVEEQCCFLLGRVVTIDQFDQDLVVQVCDALGRLAWEKTRASDTFWMLKTKVKDVLIDGKNPVHVSRLDVSSAIKVFSGLHRAGALVDDQVFVDRFAAKLIKRADSFSMWQSIQFLDVLLQLKGAETLKQKHADLIQTCMRRIRNDRHYAEHIRGSHGARGLRLVQSLGIEKENKEVLRRCFNWYTTRPRTIKDLDALVLGMSALSKLPEFQVHWGRLSKVFKEAHRQKRFMTETMLKDMVEATQLLRERYPGLQQQYCKLTTHFSPKTLAKLAAAESNEKEEEK